jgi:hypothetical protein
MGRLAKTRQSEIAHASSLVCAGAVNLPDFSIWSDGVFRKFVRHAAYLVLTRKAGKNFHGPSTLALIYELFI